MKKKGKTNALRWMILIVILLIVVLYMFFNFSVRIKNEAEETVRSELVDAAEKSAVQISAKIQRVSVAGEVIAQVLKDLSANDEEDIGRYMLAVAEKTGAYEAVFYEKDKDGIDQNETHIELSGKQYFSFVNGLTEETQYTYLKDDELTGQAAMLFLVPVPDREAALLLFYAFDNFKELLEEDSEYGRTAAIAISDAGGNILEHNDSSSNYLSSGNLWTYVGEEYGRQIGEMKFNMQKNNSGFCVMEADGEEKTLIYIPIGINDWTFVVGVDQNYVKQRTSRSIRKTSIMLYQLLGVVLLFATAFGGTHIFTRLKNEEKRKALQEKADTDLLTGLYNKLATERKIKEYMRENPKSLAMMFVLDIDNFKKINDTMGHAFGDEVLSDLGKRISANFRVSDIIGRTGGDEFIIFLKALKDDSNTLREAQKLVNFFKNFQVGEYVKYSATASIGAAVFPADGADFDTLYKAADQALYKAKKRGKNQLAFYDDRDQKV